MRKCNYFLGNLFEIFIRASFYLVERLNHQEFYVCFFFIKRLWYRGGAHL